MDRQVPFYFRFGQTTLVPDERRLLRAGQPVSLTPKAFDLLAFLVANAGRLLSKDEILQAVWQDVAVEESSLTFHIFGIRKALGDGMDADPLIETVPKRGYRFVAPVERIAHHRADTTSHPIQRFQEQVWGRPAEPLSFAISPDGYHLLMAIQDPRGVASLWVRALSDPAPKRLVGTESFLTPPPIWSARSNAIAFGHGGPLKRIAVSGGVAQDVCPLPGIAVGGCWNSDDELLIGNPAGSLLRCSAADGHVTPVTDPREPFEIHLMPSFLSDGRHFIYLRIFRLTPERSGVYLGCLDDDGPSNGRQLLSSGFNAIHVPASDAGRATIVFLRDRSLMAQRLDEERLELTGAPVQIADNVGSFLDYAFFSVSPRVLVYREPDPPCQLTWFDRGGHDIGRVGSPEPVAGLALSPRGTRALVARHVPHNVADQDLWLLDLEHGTNPRRQTFGPTLEFWPSWLSDDRFAYGAGGGELGIYQQRVDGPRRLWLASAGVGGVTSGHGGRVAVFVAGHPETRADLWVWTEQGPPGGSPIIVREGDQVQAQLSPDARWLAYVSNESGRQEVFVAPFRYDDSSGEITVGNSTPVSDGGGFAPRWRGDGLELFYLTIDGSVMVLGVDAEAGVKPGTAERLFTVPGAFPEWGVVPDGSRFLLAVPTAPSQPLQIVQNWQSALPD